MKKLTCFLIAAFLVLTLCACGTQPPEATAPIEPTDQIQNATETTAAPADTIHPTDIFGSIEPTTRPNIWVHTAYPSRETFSVEVRLQVVTETGTIEHIDLSALAVEYPNDWAEPLLNLVNGINPIEILEVWLRSEDFHIDHVNCCQSYYISDDGWFKVNCFQKHQDSVTATRTPTYQLVSVDEDGTPVNAIYTTLCFYP